MAQVINTNALSLMAQNNLNKSQTQLGTAIQRLSSGMRINSAKDDAAGLAISNRFTSSIRGMTGRHVTPTTVSPRTDHRRRAGRSDRKHAAYPRADRTGENGTNSASDRLPIKKEITTRLKRLAA